MRAIGSFHGGLINTRLQPGITSIQRMSRFNPDFAIKLLVGGGASHNVVSNATHLEIGNQSGSYSVICGFYRSAVMLNEAKHL
jgi:hypothetical protein